MTLAKNQIEHLFIWVHPAYEPVLPYVMQEWKLMIDVLQHEPRCALIETSLNCRDDEPEYIDHALAVADLERYAKGRLGVRYHLWDSGAFVRPEEPHHVERLKKALSVEERVLSRGSNPKLFRSVSAYGLLPDACVNSQTNYFGMERISDERDSLGELPISFLPAHVPSTKEAFDAIKGVRYRRWTHEMIYAKRKMLPTVEDVVRSCLQAEGRRVTAAQRHMSDVTLTQE
jgi:hypothetical protein